LDFDGNGQVNFDDLLQLAQSYGNSRNGPIEVGDFGENWERAENMV
jgi:hypothetical protein